MERSEIKDRISYLDIAKGLGIVLMVMGHIGFGRAFYKFIHAFHMPLFLWISGYLFADRGQYFFSVVTRKAQKLLVPYIIFGGALFNLGID